MTPFALLAIDRGERLDCSTRSGNERETGLRSGSENNVSIASPASTPPEIAHRSENHRRTATDRDFFSVLNVKNPSHCPSGEKKGPTAPSVPAIGFPSKLSISRR